MVGAQSETVERIEEVKQGAVKVGGSEGGVRGR